MRKRDRKIFFASFFSTLCVIALLFGLAEVDANSRRIGFGDNKTLMYQMTGKTWQESCNAVKIWYNDFISLLTEKDVKGSDETT